MSTVSRPMLPRRRFLTLATAFAAGLGVTRRVRALEYASGNVPNLASAPRRLIAVHPPMVESVVFLGAEDRLVGIGGVVQYPKSVLSLPRIGGALNFSVEATIALKPDLVVMPAVGEAAAQLAGPLTTLGIPLFLAPYGDFTAITRYIRLLGNTLDLRQSADRLIAGMQAKVAKLAKTLEGRPLRRVYLETGAVGTGSYQTIRAGHYAEDTIARAGGANAFSLKGLPQVTLEGIAAADPDVIVVLASAPNMTAASVASRPGWTALRAVREGRLGVIPRGFMLVPGPRQPDAVEVLARAIHPEAFL